MERPGQRLMDRPGYLSLKKAAAWAGVSIKTLERWTHRGLPRYQAGPREKVLIRLSDIDCFLTRVQPPALSIEQMVAEVLAELKSSK